MPDITRRTLFTTLLSGAAATPLALTQGSRAEPLEAATLAYQDRHGRVWRVRWLGWQRQPDADYCYGVWTAVCDAHRVYSTSGGIVDWYRPGECFNISTRNRPRLTGESPPTAFAAAQRAARDALVGYLDAHPTLEA